MNIAAQTEALFENQIKSWQLAKTNYNDLAKVKLRILHCNGHEIFIQFNPNRILSSAAKVDHQSISARPCFLCEKNRPVEQQCIIYRTHYAILVNPYPVFTRHLTIPTIHHVPQAIMDNFATMLYLAKDLNKYVLIYNGPNCGASAPDHFHFQAVMTDIMPVHADFLRGNCHPFQDELNGI